MRFLVDECLHESLVGVAHGAGYEASHVNHLGLSGKKDWELGIKIHEHEFTFVTNNRVDFLRLFGAMELHAGPIIIVPSVVPKMRRVLFKAALHYFEGRELINTALEIAVAETRIRCVEYAIPPST